MNAASAPRDTFSFLTGTWSQAILLGLSLPVFNGKYFLIFPSRCVILHFYNFLTASVRPLAALIYVEDNMPKIKTNRGAAKRFKITGSGKIKRVKAYHSHILTTKSRKRKRSLRKLTLIDHSDERAIRQMLPYA